MSSSLYARLNSIIPIVATVSLLGKEGYFYKLDASNQAILCAAATDVPNGLILATRPDGLEISAAPLGGNHGTCRVKLGGAVTDLRLDLTLRADATAESDDGSGGRVVVARPLETGAVDEKIECVLLPVSSVDVPTAEAALTSVQNATTAAVDLPTAEALANALKANYNALQADVAAIRAALVARGIII